MLLNGSYRELYDLQFQKSSSWNKSYLSCSLYWSVLQILMKNEPIAPKER
jgi:hypothetical protein